MKKGFSIPEQQVREYIFTCEYFIFLYTNFFSSHSYAVFYFFALSLFKKSFLKSFLLLGLALISTYRVVGLLTDRRLNWPSSIRKCLRVNPILFRTSSAALSSASSFYCHHVFIHKNLSIYAVFSISCLSFRLPSLVLL